MKRKKIKVRDRHLHYLVIKEGNHYYLKQRKEKDIWIGLYDFPVVEGEMDEEAVLNQAKAFLDHSTFVVEEISVVATHLLSHQRLLARFYHLTVAKPLSNSVMQKIEIQPFSVEEILNLPKPKLIVNHLEERGII